MIIVESSCQTADQDVSADINLMRMPSRIGPPVSKLTEGNRRSTPGDVIQVCKALSQANAHDVANGRGASKASNLGAFSTPGDSGRPTAHREFGSAAFWPRSINPARVSDGAKNRMASEAPTGDRGPEVGQAPGADAINR